MIAFWMTSGLSRKYSGVSTWDQTSAPRAVLSASTRVSVATSASLPNGTPYSISCRATTSASRALIAVTILASCCRSSASVSAPRALPLSEVRVTK